MVVEDTKRVKDYLNKSKLTTLDYVINPFVGCPAKCLYCYAAYMVGFSKHSKAWGEFIDIKQTRKRINIFKIKNKKVLISTVTDPYNPYEKKHEITRKIMTQLVPSEAFISVVTKYKLVLRDVDLFKKMKHVEIALSISTVDENMRKKLEPFVSSVEERLETLKILKENGIRTVVFIAPVIPEITDFKKIIELTKDYTDEYWFDCLLSGQVLKQISSSLFRKNIRYLNRFTKISTTKSIRNTLKNFQKKLISIVKRTV